MSSFQLLLKLLLRVGLSVARQFWFTWRGGTKRGDPSRPARARVNDVLCQLFDTSFSQNHHHEGTYKQHNKQTSKLA